MKYQKQSRFRRVKCCMYGELTCGRKADACGAGVASHCYIIKVIPPYVVRRKTAKGGIIMFRDSARELRRVQVIAICGVMGALAVVLGYVATLRIGDYIRVGFSFLPNVIVDYLFGPVVGGIFGGVMDIVKYLMNPTGPFFPGFTISAVVGAVIYGIMFYRQKITILRVLAAQLIVKVAVNLLLNTIWLVVLYGYGLAAILPGRIISNAVMLPIDTSITYLVLIFIEKNMRHLL